MDSTRRQELLELEDVVRSLDLTHHYVERLAKRITELCSALDEVENELDNMDTGQLLFTELISALDTAFGKIHERSLYMWFNTVCQYGVSDEEFSAAVANILRKLVDNDQGSASS